MRVYEVQDAFGLSQLRQVERDLGQPGPGEVAVDVRAASLNYRDLLVVEGLYNPKQPLPFVPLSDGAGVVAEVGAGVDDVAVGQRVMGCFAPHWLDGPPERRNIRQTLGAPLAGMLTERVVLPAHGVVPSPAHLTPDEAATLPCAGVTAYSALFELFDLRPWHTVLCLGTGGVSTFALSLAKAAGARVIVTSSSDDKLARARALGADHGINYKDEPKWGAAARDFSEGGVDVVIEVGGMGTLAQSLKAVKPGGTIALIGVLSAKDGRPQTPDLTSALMAQVRIQGVLVGHRRSLVELSATMARHDLHPVIDERFPFDEAGQAFAALGSAGHVGKIVVDRFPSDEAGA